MFQIGWTAPGGNNSISSYTFAGRTHTPAGANNYGNYSRQWLIDLYAPAGIVSPAN